MKFVRPSLFLTGVLWLLGTVAYALPTWAEVISYRVYLGPMYAGKVTFESNVTATDYTIRATLKDSLPFVVFDDMIRVQGKVTDKGWKPELYEQRLQENDYTAHKQVTYEKGATRARFENLLDPQEKSQDIKVPKGSVDTLTNLWNLRKIDPATLTKPLDQKVMGLKRAIDQRVEVGAIGTQKIREKNRIRLETLRQITMTMTDEDKPDKSSVWNIYVRPEASGDLRPVMFTTQTRYGDFAAYLQDE